MFYSICRFRLKDCVCVEEESTELSGFLTRSNFGLGDSNCIPQCSLFIIKNNYICKWQQEKKVRFEIIG